VVGALSLVVRFRRARGTERQQRRWVALAAMLVAVAILVALAGMAAGSDLLIIWGADVGFAVLPPAIGAAILRYRLYDLDRIVSRTLAYGLLTVLLAGGYAAVALGLRQLLGRDSSLSWRPPPWPWRRCSSRLASASRPWSIAASTGATTTPARRLRRSAPACATSSTWTRSRPKCLP
jgi:hypothetical protein